MNSIKQFKQKKKVIAIIMLFIILLSNISTVFAANQTITGTGSETFMARQYASKIKTTVENDENGIIARRLIRRKGEKWSFGDGDGILVFCAQQGVHYKTGTDYEGSYYPPTSDQLKRAAKIAYFGWYQERGTYGSDGNFADPTALKQYAFTQQMIWEELGYDCGTFVEPAIQSEYETFKNEVNSKKNKMTQRPSFDNTTINLKIGETKQVTDTNEVLADYETIDVTENNIRIQHNKGENFMTFTVNENCTIESYKILDDTFMNWGMIKSGTENKSSTVYIEFASDVQDQIYSLNYNDPVTLRVNLAIEALGGLTLKKQGENGESLNGAKFLITGPNDYNKEVTVNGSITLEGLKQGTYHIKEIQAPKRICTRHHSL